MCDLKVKVLVTQSCPTICDPVDCSLPGSSTRGFSRQEYWSGLPCAPSGDLPNPGSKPTSLTSPVLAGGVFTTEPWRKLLVSETEHDYLLLWPYFWRRKWRPTPVFLARQSHGQRSLVGYSPWGRRVRHSWSDLACKHHISGGSCGPVSGKSLLWRLQL